MTELCTRTAAELAGALRRKEVSSLELLDAYLGRIDRLDPAINAVVTLDADRARRTAAAYDAAAVRDEWVGRLHGLPVTIKDALATEGIRSTGGAAELRDHVPVADAPAVARLKTAGAIVFGKTNVPPWSADVQTFNDLFGQTNNPWDLTRTPGGSSGASAAAVAAGLTSFEVGTDIAGSVRVPAHHCGVFGLKPSEGVVSQLGCLYSAAGGATDIDLNVVGPIARSADDLDLLLSVLAGPDPARALAWRIELPPPRANDLSGYRIAVWGDERERPVDHEYASMLEATADRLADAGAQVEEARPPVELAEARQLYSVLGLATTLFLPEKEATELCGSHYAWLQNDLKRAGVRAKWAAWFERFDVLLCPVTPSAAPPHDHTPLMFRRHTVNGETRSAVETMAWTCLANLAGLPAAVAPIGLTSERLPVGVQCVAPFLRDRDALRVAALIQHVCPPVGPLEIRHLAEVAASALTDASRGLPTPAERRRVL